VRTWVTEGTFPGTSGFRQVFGKDIVDYDCEDSLDFARWGRGLITARSSSVERPHCYLSSRIQSDTRVRRCRSWAFPTKTNDLIRLLCMVVVVAVAP
jgi:hypothetical protein